MVCGGGGGGDGTVDSRKSPVSFVCSFVGCESFVGSKCHFSHSATVRMDFKSSKLQKRYTRTYVSLKKGQASINVNILTH